ncbi:MAG: lipopolysaccharide heptosyltransferase II [Limisphaerales bacterium]
MNPPRRILVRGVNWLGDAVMTTPALLRLREAHPEASITVLTPSKWLDLWKGHPAVDDLLGVESGEGAGSVGRRIRTGRFDTALVLPNSPRSALECFLGRIPRRIGLRRPWRNLFLTEAIPPRLESRAMRKPSLAEIRARLAGKGIARPSDEIRPEAHHLRDYLHLAAVLGADPTPLPPQLMVAAEERRAALDAHGGGSRRDGSGGGTGAAAEGEFLLGLNPGAEYGPAKRWPAERFAAVANAVVERLSGRARWLLFGGRGDQATTSAIAREVSGSVDLAGRTTLRELMALLAACRVVLTNDTGPMHVAAALGVPVVVPFGSTSPEMTGPGMPGDPRNHLLRAGVPCAPCFLRECPIDFRCMNGISVARVVDAVLAAAGGTSAC